MSTPALPTRLSFRRHWRSLLLLAVAALLVPAAALGADDEDLDALIAEVQVELQQPTPLEKVSLDDWRHIPVFHRGRTMPLDTLASLAVETICNSSKGTVKLGLEDYYPAGKMDSYPQAFKVLNGSKTRKWQAEEVLLSWLVESEKWEQVPFIHAAHKDLRKVLGVPENGPTGMHLNYVSPAQVYKSQSLRKYLKEQHERRQAARQAGKDPKVTELDKLVRGLLESYGLYRSLTLDPTLPLSHSPVVGVGARDRFLKHLSAAVALADEPNAKGQKMIEMLGIFQQAPDGSPLRGAAIRTLQAFDRVHQLGALVFAQEDGEQEEEVETELHGPKLADVERAVVEMRNATGELATLLTEQRDQLYDQLNPSTDNRIDVMRTVFRELAFKVRDLERLSLEMHLALYDNGDSVYVIPSLNAGAMNKDRDVTNDAQPWINLQTVLVGSDALLFDSNKAHSDDPQSAEHDPLATANYPRDKILAVRALWKNLANAYVQRANEDRPNKVAQAQRQLADGLFNLGEAVEPIRQDLVATALPKDKIDLNLIGYTDYPQPGDLNYEVRYNQIDPFKWSWILSLGAVFAFGLSFGVMRKPMFWLGMGVLLLGIAWTTYGFFLRVMITQWAPVTNMYETVVFVPYVISLLGAWFILLPINWTGIANGWRLNALPMTWEATPLTGEQLALMPRTGWDIAGWALALARLGLMSFLFWFLAISTSYADGNRTVFQLLPSISGGDLAAMLNDAGVWAVSLVCFAASLWFLPRVALMVVAALVMIPVSWFTAGGWSRMVEQVYPRFWFGLAATCVAALGAWVAWYSPVLDENFSPLQPVLRSNFWLTIHVLTIVASYGAGLLAWGLGTIALFAYLFGQYRRPISPAELAESMMAQGQDPKTSLPVQILRRSSVVGVATDPAVPLAETAYLAAKRPPEICAALAHYAYRAVQVAVLLLATGTILGGLWADVSWGRFWGWDPKEVWALISLLIYLAILHGRFAGWFSNFGLIFGTVFGATMIAFSWYGVNFILPMFSNGGSVGLHSYGTGSGGVGYVLAFVLANWVLLGLATVRYKIETGTKVSIDRREPGAADQEPADKE